MPGWTFRPRSIRGHLLLRRPDEPVVRATRRGAVPGFRDGKTAVPGGRLGERGAQLIATSRFFVPSFPQGETMNGFIFASGVNNPNHGNDAKGAFIPGAKAFKKIHKIPQEIFYFDHREADATLRTKILDKFMVTPCEDPDGFDVVAYFGHGIKRGLPS